MKQTFQVDFTVTHMGTIEVEAGSADEAMKAVDQMAPGDLLDECRNVDVTVEDTYCDYDMEDADES